MTKLIQTLKHYIDFRLLLNEDYLLRTERNPSYSLRAYARDLEVSVSQLSKVLNRKSVFSESTGVHILKKLGLWEEDPEYAKKLVLNDLSKTHDEFISHQNYLRSKMVGHGFLPNEKKDDVIKSVENFLFYGFVVKFNSLSKVLEICNKIGLDSEKVQKAKEALFTKGYIAISDDRVEITDRSFFIERHDELYLHHSNFNHFISEKILEKKYLDKPDSDGKGAILGLDENTAVELKSYIDHFFRGLYRIANKTTVSSKILLISTSSVGWNLDEVSVDSKDCGPLNNQAHDEPNVGPH
ncbi:MAG: hypothetical protein KDD50_11000 [Bdellovibrionales bacterium]|nr:hypothetical protein [Bdellovibrionales bacterium]